MSETSENLNAGNIPMYVMVVSLPEPSPLGCIQDIDGLRLLAECSGT